MLRPIKGAIAIAAIGLALAACTDSLTSDSNLALNEAFQSVPLGFSANSNSFDPAGDRGTAFYPGVMTSAQSGMRGMGGQGGPMGQGGQAGGGRGQGGRGGHGPNGADRGDGFGPGARGLMMGGGLGPDFIGAMGFGGMHRGRGPFGTFTLPAECVFDATSGRVGCPDVTNNGLTIQRSFAFKAKDGTAQAQYDTATTDLVNIVTNVQGTRSRPDGAATSTVLHTSDRTIDGLSSGSTARTMNGESRAEETTTGTRDGVAFTATRIAGDTTIDLVIPVVAQGPGIPTSGTVIRGMWVRIAPVGVEPTERARREVITYNGTNVVSVQITQDGVTRSCTITLPGRRLVCD